MSWFKQRECVVDVETRRKKQQAMMTELLERKIRLHAQRLYDERGRIDGHALQDWVQAESEVLGNSVLGSLYRRTREGFVEENSFLDESASEIGA
jgi:hypothetical protein